MVSADIKIKSLALLMAELVLIASSAVWPEIHSDSYVPVVVYTILLCAGGYVLSNSQKWMAYYLAVSVIVVITTYQGHWLTQVANIVSITIIYVMLFYQVVKHSFFKSNISRVDQIISGIVGYLLLGLFWALQYRWLDVLSDDGFLNTVTNKALDAADQVYFSFVTLTTLGYGEILPTSPIAKVLVLFTSVSGTLYLAVFIACIIGSKGSKA